MRISRYLGISVVALLLVSCRSHDSEAGSSSVERNPLALKIEKFYTLFQPMPPGELSCKDMMGGTKLGKEMVMEYVNAQVREWTVADWEETSYHAVWASHKDGFFLFAIQRKVPGSESTNLYTYDSNGMRQSVIPVCEVSPGGEISSIIKEDHSILRTDEYGVSSYQLNSRGFYVKGK